MESDQASNDATTIISELLNSDEPIQSSVSNVHPPPMPIIEQKDENQNVIINAGFTTNCDKQEMLIPMQQNSVLMINNSYAPETDEINKMQFRHVHIPYILNGELYQIQTQDGENVTVKCCHCPPDRVYRGSVRSTGNFHMHIKVRLLFLIIKKREAIFEYLSHLFSSAPSSGFIRKTS